MLDPGTDAPDFEVPDHEGNPVRLSDLRGERVVLWFFPKADTPGCTAQGCAYRDSYAGFRNKDVKVLGVSFDSPEDNRAFVEKFSFPFPLLCDTERTIGMAYGAAERPDDAYARRITYVISPEGKIEQAIDTRNPGAQAAELLAKL